MEQGCKQVYSEQVDVSKDFQFYRIYHHLTINLSPGATLDLFLNRGLALLSSPSDV
jgi:hypothetical protein